jgi:phosphotransferase system  glucose/maltose/N-acetylglucosamine-specific IIC component
MKQKLNSYLKLTFFILLFGFLIWGLIHLLLNFSIQTNGVLTFLSVIIPHGIALAYIGYNVVVSLLKIKNLKTPARVVIVDPKQ